MATRVLRTVLQGVLLAIPLTALLGSFPSSGLSQDRPINIKMASLAPANTVWHDVLMDMGARWREVSGGKVNLQIIPSGQGGEEDDVLRRMRLGQFQAGGFTLAGLQRLSPAVVVLAIPLAIESQAALHRVRAAVGPELEEIFLEKGYVLLHWVDMGWMRFFTKDPDPSPDAIRRYTFVEWAENSSTALWRDAGFRPGARLNIADVTVGLQTGLLDALNTAPLVVYGYQWFTCLDFMIDLRFVPEIVEFEGFINYGSPIQTGGTDMLGNPVQITLTENRIEMPVFSSRRVNTALTIYDGYTVAIGGLISESVQNVEDKVPILGDIPFIGRLFQTKAENRIKSNLIIFVTAQIIDATGRPLRGADAGATVPAAADAAAIGELDGVLPPL